MYCSCLVVNIFINAFNNWMQVDECAGLRDEGAPSAGEREGARGGAADAEARAAHPVSSAPSVRLHNYLPEFRCAESGPEDAGHSHSVHSRPRLLQCAAAQWHCAARALPDGARARGARSARNARGCLFKRAPRAVQRRARRATTATATTAAAAATSAVRAAAARVLFHARYCCRVECRNSLVRATPTCRVRCVPGFFTLALKWST